MTHPTDNTDVSEPDPTPIEWAEDSEDWFDRWYRFGPVECDR